MQRVLEGAVELKIVCTTPAGSPASLSWSPSGDKREGSKAQAGDEILSFPVSSRNIKERYNL